MEFFCVVSGKRLGAIVLTGVFLLTKVSDVSLLTISVNPTNGKAILGDNPFTLSCTYTLGQNEQLFHVELRRKRDTEDNYSSIVTYQNPSSTLNLTYQDTSLESRTVATKPTESTRTATLVFNTVACDDKATYLWDAFYSDGANQHAIDTSTVTVKAVSLFSQDGRISYSPQTNLEEGDNVQFTCSGDVGNEPVGYLGWFYYLGNNTSNAINASDRAISSPPTYRTDTCSFTRSSTLELTMTPNFNALLVRCTAQQENFSHFGEAYVQTKHIPVYYSPKITAIDDMDVEEGTELLTLTCKADAYPVPTFFWFLPNGTETSGPILKLTDLQVGDHGIYTCVVSNTYKNSNHTVNETLYLHVHGQRSLEFSPSDTRYALPEYAMFSPVICRATCDPACSFKWTKVGQVRAISNSSVLDLGCLTRSDAGTYKCTASTSDGFSFTKDLVINILSYPVPGPAGFTLQKDKNMRWTPLLSNEDLQILSSGLQTNLTILNVSRQDLGQYRLIVTNEIGRYEQYMYLAEERSSDESAKDYLNTTALIVGVTLGFVSAVLAVYSVYITIWVKRKMAFKGGFNCRQKRKDETYMNEVSIENIKTNETNPSPKTTEVTESQYTTLDDNFKDMNVAYEVLQTTRT